MVSADHKEIFKEHTPKMFKIRSHFQNFLLSMDDAQPDENDMLKVAVAYSHLLSSWIQIGDYPENIVVLVDHIPRHNCNFGVAS